jgi:mpaB/rubber oxygenase-like protein
MAVPASDTRVWPTHRGSEYSIRRQFGDASADLLRHALYTGDPLADAIVAEIHGEGGANTARQLRQGIAEGLQSLSRPSPAVAALLASTESMPDFVDDELLAAGSRPYFSVAPIFQQIALAVGSLVNVYSSPSIAKVLSNTGRLVEGTERRVVETGKWLLGAMLPDELRPGRAGYVATLQVRMLHANIRWSQQRHGHDAAVYGTPINQADLARTWLDFTYTPYGAVESLGVGFTADEMEQTYRMWWYLGHLLGVDPALYQGIRSQSDAKQLLSRLDATNEAVNEQGAALTDAVLGVVAQILKEQTKLPRPVARSIVNALAWRIHGPAKATALKVPRSPFTWVLSFVARKVSHDRAKLRANPRRWELEIDKITASARVLLESPDSPTAFQTNLG